jgi:hypothetical protein
MSTRQLNTDEEEQFFDAQRPVILNGIEDIALNPDLADRAIIVNLPASPKKDGKRNVSSGNRSSESGR